MGAQFVGPTLAQIDQESVKRFMEGMKGLTDAMEARQKDQYEQSKDVFNALAKAYNGDLQKLANDPSGEQALRSFMKSSGKKDADIEAYVHAFKSAPPNILSRLSDELMGAVEQEGKQGEQEPAAQEPTPSASPSPEQGAAGAYAGLAPKPIIQGPAVTPSSPPSTLGAPGASGTPLIIKPEQAPLDRAMRANLDPATKQKVLANAAQQAMQQTVIKGGRAAQRSGMNGLAFVQSIVRNPDYLNAIALLNPSTEPTAARISAALSPENTEKQRIELETAKVKLQQANVELDMKQVQQLLDQQNMDARNQIAFYDTLAAYYRMNTALAAAQSGRFTMTTDMANAKNEYTNALKMRASISTDPQKDPARYVSEWNAANALVTANALVYNGLLQGQGVTDQQLFLPVWGEMTVGGIAGKLQGLNAVQGGQIQQAPTPQGALPSQTTKTKQSAAGVTVNPTPTPSAPSPTAPPKRSKEELDRLNSLRSKYGLPPLAE